MLTPRTALIALLLAAAPLHAADRALPTIDGELSGELSQTFLPGAPHVRWTATIRGEKADFREVAVSIDGQGLRLRIEGTLRADYATGEWKIIEATVDARHWMPPALAYLQGKPSTHSATGTITLSGGGRLRDGVPSGTVQVRWDNGELRDSSGGWSLEGITAAAPLSFDASGDGTLQSTAPVTLKIATITTPRFGARNLAIAGDLKSLEAFELSSAELEMAGGFVAISPTRVSLRPVQMLLDLQVRRIGLQDVAALVPELVKAAYGRVDGEVRLAWSLAGGLSLDRGHIVLREDEPAAVTLAPSPGLITGRLPAQVLKYYPGLDKAELGLVPIRARELEVQFHAQPDAEGRTARIHLFGVPDDPNARGPLNLDVNVRGPLGPFIKLGTSTRFSLGIR